MAYPKKLSAYMLYNNAHRESTKAELIASGNEKPSIAEIAKAVSIKWNALSDEEKAVRAMRMRCDLLFFLIGDAERCARVVTFGDVDEFNESNHFLKKTRRQTRDGN